MFIRLQYCIYIKIRVHNIFNFDEVSFYSTELFKVCRRDEFTCDDGQCVFDRWKAVQCGGKIDCDDQSDEKDCPGNKLLTFLTLQ